MRARRRNQFERLEANRLIKRVRVRGIDKRHHRRGDARLLIDKWTQLVWLRDIVRQPRLRGIRNFREQRKWQFNHPCTVYRGYFSASVAARSGSVFMSSGTGNTRLPARQAHASAASTTHDFPIRMPFAVSTRVEIDISRWTGRTDASRTSEGYYRRTIRRWGTSFSRSSLHFPRQVTPTPKFYATREDLTRLTPGNSWKCGNKCGTHAQVSIIDFDESWF